MSNNPNYPLRRILAAATVAALGATGALVASRISENNTPDAASDITRCYVAEVGAFTKPNGETANTVRATIVEALASNAFAGIPREELGDFTGATETSHKIIDSLDDQHRTAGIYTDIQPGDTVPFCVNFTTSEITRYDNVAPVASDIQ